MQIVAIEFSILAGSIGMVELDLCKKNFNSFTILTKPQQQNKTQCSKIISNFDENDRKITVSSINRDISFKCCKEEGQNDISRQRLVSCLIENVVCCTNPF